MHVVKPIFKDLWDVNLLKCCLPEKTQNPNESINGDNLAKGTKTSFCKLSGIETKRNRCNPLF